MTTNSDHDHPAAQTGAPDALAELFRHVSARERPPREIERSVRQSVHEEWRRVTGAASRHRTGIATAVAASALLAFALVVMRSGTPVPGHPALARVEKVTGTALHLIDGGSERALGSGDDFLAAGSRLSTARASGLALRWMDGSVIRVDENTELALVSDSGIRLLRGAVYMDTRRAGSAGASPGIITPQGRISHLGTRYMTRVSPDGTTVSVRAGAVSFRADGEPAGAVLRAAAGQQLVIASTGGTRLQGVSTWGEEWAWAEGLSTGFDADGRPLEALFEWVANETGRKVAYASPEARQLASGSLLRGRFELAPLKALSVASATSDLVAEVRGGEVLVRLREP